MTSKTRNVRYSQFFLLFCTLVIDYGQRLSFVVATIALSDDKTPPKEIPVPFDWSKTDKIETILFWGYLVPQVAAGQLGEYFGPKWFLIATLVVGSTFHILLPTLQENLGSTGKNLCRFGQGLCKGFVYPSLHTLLSKWSPLSERTRISSIVYGGASVGLVLSVPFVQCIKETSLGWIFPFYMYGIAGMVYSLILAVFVKNSPSDHAGITEEERLYIESSNFINNRNTKRLRTPWKSILTSLPLWAVLIANCGRSWGTFIYLTDISIYMFCVMDFNIANNFVLATLPFFSQFLLSLTLGPIVDKIIIKKTLSILTTRKILISLGTFIPAAALFALGFLDKSHFGEAMLLFVIAVAFSGCNESGGLVNIIDLAPNYAGTLLGIINGTSMMFAILGPLTVEWLGKDKTDLQLWRKVFWSTAGIYITCGLFFNFCASGKVQPWNDIENKEDDRKDNQTVSSIA